MTISSSALALLATGLFMSACASVSREGSQTNSASSLRQSAQLASSQSSGSSERQGSVAAGWTDDYTAANLFERAVAADNSVLNRFNLAAAYQRTGRDAQAAAIYRTLVVDGSNTVLLTIDDNFHRAERERGFNAGQEASQRLAAIEKHDAALLAKRRAYGAAPYTALKNQGELSDRNAARLDRNAEAVQGAGGSPQPR